MLAHATLAAAPDREKGAACTARPDRADGSPHALPSHGLFVGGISADTVPRNGPLNLNLTSIMLDDIFIMFKGLILRNFAASKRGDYVFMAWMGKLEYACTWQPCTCPVSCDWSRREGLERQRHGIIRTPYDGGLAEF